MEAIKLIIVGVIVALAFSALPALFGWLYVKAFLLDWERRQSEVLITETTNHEKQTISCNPSHDVDCSNVEVIYRGKRVENLPPEESMKVIRHIAAQNNALIKDNRGWKEACMAWQQLQNTNL